MNFLIKTLGCRVNRAESREIAQNLQKRGWQEGEPPQLIVVNSCCVTQKAEKETRQLTRSLRRKYPQSFLVVVGCSVDYWRLRRKLRAMKKELKADLLLENKRKLALPRLIKSVRFHLRGGKATPPRVFLKVQNGCNQFCSYCVVPFLRGRSRSFSPEKIIKQIKLLEKRGVKEIILCGINLADYQFPVTNAKSQIKNENLSLLVKKILKETNVLRIRLGSINLNAFDDEFISLWSDKRLCPHFHIPLQSGSDKILQAMGRRYSFAEFRKKLKKIKAKVDLVNITTDVLVGFPGETEEDFEKGLANLKTLEGLVSKIHVFRYSKRELTKAAKLANQIEEAVKRKRAEKIRKLSQKWEEQWAKKMVGKKLSVLVEKENKGVSEGLSENHFKVLIKKKGLQGKIVDVRIRACKERMLYGRVEFDNR